MYSSLQLDNEHLELDRYPHPVGLTHAVIAYVSCEGVDSLVLLGSLWHYAGQV